MIYNDFLKTIKKYGMFSAGEKIVAGVSGGIDSMVLLALLQKLTKSRGGELVALHLNHSLRGAESDRDENFVKNAAKAMNIRCITKTLDIGVIARNERLNMQEAARRERYAFFEAVLDELKFNRIAVGHNADDQAETMLMRIIRGSGIKGLGGVPPVRGAIIRPLIDLTREEIKDYAATEGICYVEDSSNLKKSYLRNRLRQQLVPLLKEFNPRVCHELNMLSSINRDVEAYLSEEAVKVFNKAISPGKEDAGNLSLDIAVFNETAAPLKAKVIMMAVEKLTGSSRGIFSTHILDVENLALKGKSGGSINLPKGITVELEYGSLVFSLGGRPERVGHFSYRLNLEGETKIDEAGILLKTAKVGQEVPNLSDDKDSIFIDMARLSAPLEVRNFMAGDRIRIKGMSGRKKLKDLFIDEKVPARLRSKVPILVSGEEILWVIGLRKSPAAITEAGKGDLIRVQSLDLSC